MLDLDGIQRSNGGAQVGACQDDMGNGRAVGIMGA
jgi:hypothetical protein